jgi:hypothetical protein
MVTRQIFLRERCKCPDVLTYRRRFLLGATAIGELSNVRRAHVERFVAARRLNVLSLLVVVFTGLWFGGGEPAHAAMYPR